MDADIRQAHLKAIDNDDTRAAYNCIVDGFEAAGLRASPNSGHVSAVRFHNLQQDYLLSFIVDRAHLLFYLRTPLLLNEPQLSRVAFDNHQERVRVNNAGEITIRIESKTDAQRLVSWLKQKLAPDM